MKITFKIYQQPEADFEVEAEASDTVANLKVKIYDSQGHDIAKQNILFCGRVLVDDRTLESYRISDKGFLVLMISRPRPKFPPPPPELAQYFNEDGEPIFSLAALDNPPELPTSVLVPETTSAPGSISTFKYVPMSSSAPVPVTTSTPDLTATSTPVPISTASTFKYVPMSSSVPVPATTSAQDPASTSTPVTTSKSTFKYVPMSSSSTVPAITSTQDPATTSAPVTTSKSTFKYVPMSSSSTVPATISAQDPASASVPVTTSKSTFKYVPMSSSAQAPATTSAPVSASTSASASASKSTFKYVPMSSSARVPASTSTAVPTATSQQQQGGALGGVPGASSGGLADLAALRNDPQIAQFRELVTQNPELRQLFIQRIAEDNPGLALHLAQNPDNLLQLLDRAQADGGASPAASVVRLNVTEAERGSIERLEALGFPKQAVIEAYFACDKNEELAANYLFDNA